MSLLCAGATTNPTLCDGDLAGRAGAGSYAVAITDHVGRGADTVGWVLRGGGRVTVRASESAGTIVDARWVAIEWVIAICWWIFINLNRDTDQVNSRELLTILRTKFAKSVASIPRKAKLGSPAYWET